MIDLKRVERWPAMNAAEWRSIVGPDARCVLEVGSHDGRDTERLLEAFPKAEVYCWEPDPRPRERWVRRLAFPLPRRLHLSLAAVSDSDGTATWYASHGALNTDVADYGRYDPAMRADWDASGSIMRPTGHVGYPFWLDFSPEGSVPTVRLDTWWASAGEPRVDLLWADVQGAELRMLCGARAMLEHTRFVYMEVWEPAALGMTGDVPAELYEQQPRIESLLKKLPSWVPRAIVGNDNLLMENPRA